MQACSLQTPNVNWTAGSLKWGWTPMGLLPQCPILALPHHPESLKEVKENHQTNGQLYATPVPVSITVLNQSSSFSKQVSSATSCLGSAKTAQRAGRSLEHSGSMIRAAVPTERKQWISHDHIWLQTPAIATSDVCYDGGGAQKTSLGPELLSSHRH